MVTLTGWNIQARKSTTVNPSQVFTHMYTMGARARVQKWEYKKVLTYPEYTMGVQKGVHTPRVHNGCTRSRKIGAKILDSVVNI